MGNYGIKISQEGKSITSTDPRDYIFNSSYNTAAIAVQGTASQTGNSGDILTFTIAHGLPFIPFPLVFYKTSYYNNYWQWAPSGGESFLGDANRTWNTDLRIDSTNLVFRITLGNGNNDTITIKYFLLNVDI